MLLTRLCSGGSVIRLDDVTNLNPVRGEVQLGGVEPLDQVRFRRQEPLSLELGLQLNGPPNRNPEHGEGCQDDKDLKFQGFIYTSRFQLR